MTSRDRVLKVYPNAWAKWTNTVNSGFYTIHSRKEIPSVPLGCHSRESWAWAEAWREIQRRADEETS